MYHSFNDNIQIWRMLRETRVNVQEALTGRGWMFCV